MTSRNTDAANAHYRYFYPNRLGRIILQAMRLEMAPTQYLQVLESARLVQFADKLPVNNLNKEFPFEWVAALQAASEDVFGVRGGRTINRTVGRQCLNTGLKEMAPVLGVADLPLRLMPIGMKLRVGLDTFASLFNRMTDQVVQISEDDNHFHWVIERNPVCWGRHTAEPCCHLVVGILEESLFWGTGGRRFSVEERMCTATGSATCVFTIGKAPLE